MRVYLLSSVQVHFKRKIVLGGGAELTVSWVKSSTAVQFAYIFIQTRFIVRRETESKRGKRRIEKGRKKKEKSSCNCKK